MPSFIKADGYIFGAGFYPEPMIHDGIEFFYRPMTPVDSANYQAEIGPEKGEKFRAVQADWLLKKIVRWQMPEDEQGKRERVPKLSKGILMKGDENGNVIDQTLLSRMVETVIWGVAPDYRLEDCGDKETPEEAVKN